VKIESVWAGQEHSGAVATDGCVFTWGRGTEYQHGNGTAQDRHTPAVLYQGHEPSSEKPAGTAGGAQLALGGEWTLLLAHEALLVAGSASKYTGLGSVKGESVICQLPRPLYRRRAGPEAGHSQSDPDLDDAWAEFLAERRVQGKQAATESKEEEKDEKEGEEGAVVTAASLGEDHGAVLTEDGGVMMIGWEAGHRAKLYESSLVVRAISEGIELERFMTGGGGGGKEKGQAKKDEGEEEDMEGSTALNVVSSDNELLMLPISPSSDGGMSFTMQQEQYTQTRGRAPTAFDSRFGSTEGQGQASYSKEARPRFMCVFFYPRWPSIHPRLFFFCLLSPSPPPPPPPPPPFFFFFFGGGGGGAAFLLLHVHVFVYVQSTKPLTTVVLPLLELVYVL